MDRVLIKKICQHVIEHYGQDKNVLGIMLFGSVARGKFDKFSDVDTFILLDKKSKFSRKNFIEDGLRVDIILNTQKETNDYLKRDAYNVRRITSNMLAYGKILYQGNGVLDRLQSVAKRNLTLRTKYKAGEILMHKYSVDDFWGEVQRDAEHKNYLAFGLDSQLLVENIIELFLKINGSFLKQPNEMFKVLAKIDKKFAARLKGFYRASTMRGKEEILGALVEDIYKRSGGPLPQRWALRD